MKVAGIIAEYNPFHNGHAYHITQTRYISGCSHIIVAMSGHFVQRGETAIFDKWSRAKMAILGGADLIVELPFAFSVRSAQYFATGGIRLLSSLGVDYLSFGAEQADLLQLKNAATALEDPQFTQTFYSQMKQGITYAKALGATIQKQTGLDKEFISSPNNILAIEYLRAIYHCASHIKPLAISRVEANYHDTDIRSTIASATAIRRSIATEHCLNEKVRRAVPSATYNIMSELLDQQKGPVNKGALEIALLTKLRTCSLADIENTPDVSEGIHYKIAAVALKATSIDHLYSLLKNKRYLYSRLQRIMAHIIVGTKKSDIAVFDHTGPAYIRVLAFNDKGRELLHQYKSSCSLPIVVKTASLLDSNLRSKETLTVAQKMLALDTQASDIFSLGMPSQQWRSGGWDFFQSPLYIKSCLPVSKQ